MRASVQCDSRDLRNGKDDSKAQASKQHDQLQLLQQNGVCACHTELVHVLHASDSIVDSLAMLSMHHEYVCITLTALPSHRQAKLPTKHSY